MKKRVPFQGKISPNILPDGVTLSGSEIEFVGYDDDTIKGLLKRMSGLVEPTGARVKYKATETDLQLIRDHIGDPDVNLDGFGIYRAVVSSTQRDTDSDKFSQAVLEEMATQYKSGRPVVLGHTMEFGVGRVFDAVVNPKEDEEGEFELSVKFYIVPTATVPTGSIKELLDNRVYDRFSIGAYMKILDVQRDEDSGKRTYFYDHTNMVVAHLGIVDMGANTDARSKSASQSGISFGEIKSIRKMKFEKSYKNLGTVSVSLEQAPVEALLDSVEKKLNDKDQELSDANAKLKVFEDAAEAKLKSLREDWSAKQKELDPDADAEKIEKKAGLLTEDILTEEIADLKKKIAAKKNQLDPNAGGSGDPAPKGHSLQIQM